MAMMAILDEYRELLLTVDDWFDRCLQAAGCHIRCARGCSECCRGLFDITLLDAALLKSGFDRLPQERQKEVQAKAERQVARLQKGWPDFAPPYILNAMPDEQWTEMPEDDMTPCALLSDEGDCLVYADRPMTCRLHGLPNIDISGERFSDEWCTTNFRDADPLAMNELRWEFRAAFEKEIAFFGRFTSELLGAPRNELDTFIPAALLVDFDRFPWKDWPPPVSGG